VVSFLAGRTGAGVGLPRSLTACPGRGQRLQTTAGAAFPGLAGCAAGGAGVRRTVTIRRAGGRSSCRHMQ